MRTVCKREDMPSAVTVFKWMRDYPEFLKQYARAKEESADAMAEEIQDLSDEAVKMVRTGKASKVNALVQAQKLRIESRKWLASKLKPKKYGDKVDLTSDNKPINFLVPGEIKKKHAIPSHSS